MTADVLATFLTEPHAGVIATLRADGRPYTVPIWWLWEPDESASEFVAGRHRYVGGVVWFTGTTTRIWCKQLMADERASLCIESGPPMIGHVGFDGPCEPLHQNDFDIWPRTRALVEKYVGHGDPANDRAVEMFYANMLTEPRMLFRMTPTVVRAIDMRVYRGKRADRQHQEQQLGH